MEDKLYASASAGRYAIGSGKGSLITSGQRIEVLLGGQWIPGQIKYTSNYLASSNVEAGNTLPSNVGAYCITNNAIQDTVTEASEESFPASDAPAWTTSSEERPASPRDGDNVVSGYYFMSDSDGNICGLCIGMQVRVREVTR